MIVFYPKWDSQPFRQALCFLAASELEANVVLCSAAISACGTGQDARNKSENHGENHGFFLGNLWETHGKTIGKYTKTPKNIWEKHGKNKWKHMRQLVSMAIIPYFWSDDAYKLRYVYQF